MRIRPLRRLGLNPVDSTPPSREASPARATAVAIVVLVLCGACGEERSPAPRGEPFPLPTVSGEDALRDRFSLQTGEACARSYAEFGPLEAKLRRLQRAVRRRPPARKAAARRQTRQVIRRIQSSSRGFLRRLKAIPLPSSPPSRRRDASRLLESTEEVVGLQLETLDLSRRRLRERVPPAERARLSRLRRRLVAKVRDQQRLARGLGIPECVRS